MNEQKIIILVDNLLYEGDLKMQEGNLAEANIIYQKAKDNAKKLLNGLNAGYAIACDKLGDVARFSGEFRKAHELYDQALPIFSALASSNIEYQRDVSLCLSKIGELALAENDISTAREALEAHYEMAKHIAARDLSHFEHQRDLAGAHGRLQQLEMASENFTEALKHAESAHTILEKLIVINPGNVSLVQDVAGSNYMLGIILMRTGDEKRAASVLKDSLQILRDLGKQGKLDAKGKRLLKHLNDFKLMP